MKMGSGFCHRKVMYAVSSLAVLLTCAACSRKDWTPTPDGDTVIKYFSIVQNDAASEDFVKSSISGTAVVWSAGDIINYYTSRTAVSTASVLRRYVVQSGDLSGECAGAKISFPVTYPDGDEKIAFIVKGTGLGAVDDGVARNMDAVTITDGVPSAQDGTFASNNLTIGTASLSANTAALEQVQSFIKFTMADLIYADKQLTKIEITGGAGVEDICGDMTVNPGDGTVTGYGNCGKKITVDKTYGEFKKDSVYYVAVKNGTYNNGIRFTLYYVNRQTGAETKLGFVYANSPITMAAGKVLNVGEISTHREIPALSASAVLHPAYAAFDKDMTKKLYIELQPSDFTGTIEWSDTTDYVKVKMLMDGTEYKQEAKTVDGITKNYYVAEVYANPDKYEDMDYMEDYTAMLKATVKSSDGSVQELTCDVIIGAFIDLGLKAYVPDKGETSPKHERRCLWARSHLTGSCIVDAYPTTPATVITDNTLTLEESVMGAGEYYQWGCIFSTTLPTDVYTAKWGGVYARYGWINRTEEYSDADDKYDDAGTYFSYNYPLTRCRVPSGHDFAGLDFNVDISPVSVDGIAGARYTSKVVFFEDMYICIPPPKYLPQNSSVVTDYVKTQSGRAPTCAFLMTRYKWYSSTSGIPGVEETGGHHGCYQQTFAHDENTFIGDEPGNSRYFAGSVRLVRYI